MIHHIFKINDSNFLYPIWTNSLLSYSVYYYLPSGKYPFISFSSSSISKELPIYLEYSNILPPIAPIFVAMYNVSDLTLKPISYVASI